MHVYAITGGIACGKSTVSRLFAELGTRIFSADDDAREARADPAVRVRIIEALGTDDPKLLAQKIYADPDARKVLNGIVHPEVRARMRARIDAARSSAEPGLTLYEVPLLFEGNLETWFDGSVAVYAAPEVQRARLHVRHPDATQADLDARLASQLPPEEKARRADFTVRTDTNLDETRAEVEAIYAALISQPT
jgi:dephospho-CoA kinase